MAKDIQKAVTEKELKFLLATLHIIKQELEVDLIRTNTDLQTIEINTL